MLFIYIGLIQYVTKSNCLTSYYTPILLFRLTFVKYNISVSVLGHHHGLLKCKPNVFHSQTLTVSEKCSFAKAATLLI